jgi:propanediol utilization protein
MTITTNNLTVASHAPTGTTVAVLTATDATGSIIPCNFTLTKGAAGLFAISTNNLITVWIGSIAPGYYPVRVRANGINTRFSGSATFTVTVGAEPTPTGITFNPTTASLADDAAAGTTVAATSVPMSDGSVFSGALTASPADTVAISGNTHLVLARGLQAADDGPQEWMVTATQNGVTVSNPIQVQVAAGAPRPTGITFTPTAASLRDNAGAGTTVATVSVSMSKGPAFSGSLTASPAGTLTMSGNKLVLARGLTSADDGSHQWSVSATQNGVTVSGAIRVQVNSSSPPPPPPPTPTGVTFAPTTASLPDNAAAGTTVAAVTVAMSDGSTFSGSLAASPAGTVTMSGNRLVLARGLTPADDGSYQWSVSATQNGVTVSGIIQVQVNATPIGVTFAPTMASLPDNAAAGTTVAAVSVAMSNGSAFSATLAASPVGTVTMSGNKLVLARGLTAPDDGSHQWSVSATQNGVTVSGIIQVQVNATPIGVTFAPTMASLPDNSAAGTIVAAVSVAMSDGSAFSGSLAASPAGTVTMSGNRLVLVRGLTPADGGSHQWSVSATQNGVTVSGGIQVQVNATPTGITFAPTAASLPDNAAAGTTVAAVSVAMSNGSTFSGSLAASPAGTVTTSGNKLVLTRGLTAADDGSHQWSVSATQNGVTVSGGIQVQINAVNPPPLPPPGNQLTTDDGSTILTSDDGSTFLMVS